MKWFSPKLGSIVSEAANKLGFYKKLYSKSKLNIKTYKDFSELPIIDKFNLTGNHFSAFTLCDDTELSSIFSTGGTTGKPKIIRYDKKWWDKMNAMVRRTDSMIGIDDKSVVGIMFSFGGLHSAALSWYNGWMTEGTTVVSFGTGLEDEFVFEMIKKMKVTGLFAIPSYVFELARRLKKKGLNPKTLGVKTIITAAEPLTDKIRSFLEENYGCEVFDIFGTVEIGLIGSECAEHDGIHFFTDYSFPEVLNVETGEPAADGEEGELVITGLNHKGTQLIRYRTDDMVKYSTKKCKCGSPYPRFWFLGRKHFTIFIYGDNIHYFQIADSLKKVKEVSSYFQVEVSKKGSTQVLDFKIEVMNDKDICDKVANAAKDAIENMFSAFYELVKSGKARVNVKLVKSGSLPRTIVGKMKNQFVMKV